MSNLSLPQRQIIESPLDLKLFVSGPAGTGKTTAGVERMRYLLSQGVPGESILMLTLSGLCRSRILISCTALNAAQAVK